MTKTLITGINGFTGRYLADVLMAQGHEVFGIGHNEGETASAGVSEVFHCDLGDISRLAKVISDVQPDHVAHLAAIAFVAHNDVDEMYRTNVIGTRHLLDALVKLAKAPESVLLASSANIYGNAREGVIDETIPPAPANDYGVTKLVSEYVANLFRGRLPIIIVRPFNYTGVGQANNFIIPKIIDHVRRKAPEIELGNLNVARDFSDVRTVVNAYARLLAAPAAIGETINVCSGHATSLGEILEMVRKLSGHDFTVSVNPAFVRSNEVKSLCGDPSRLKSIIGPLNQPTLEETLGWMLEG